MTKNLKPWLMLFMILTGSSFAAHTQTIDTICLPVAQAKKVLADAGQKPVLQERIQLLTDDIRLLNQRIAVKDSLIAAYAAKDGNSEAIIRTMEEQKALLIQERDLHKEQVVQMEKLIRKEKRKRFWTAAGGALSTAAGLYLFITK
ncbi:MAG: hypothetical protein ACT4OJ_10950 [Bacteroidota bacterium]